MLPYLLDIGHLSANIPSLWAPLYNRHPSSVDLWKPTYLGHLSTMDIYLLLKPLHCGQLAIGIPICCGHYLYSGHPYDIYDIYQHVIQPYFDIEIYMGKKSPKTFLLAFIPMGASVISDGLESLS